MRLLPNGNVAVSSGETVTVEIEAKDTAFLASTGAIQLGQWSVLDRSVTTKEVRRFTVSGSFSGHFAFGIGFDFSLGPQGKIPATAQYTVKVSGTGPGGFIDSSTVLPSSILPTTRVFPFEVGQG